MKLSALVAAALCAAVSPIHAQHAQVSSVVVDPTDPAMVWAANRDNDSVSVIDTSVSPATVTEIAVGVNPRSVAFSADGSRVFVANQRGNVPLERNFVTPFDGTEVRGSVTVIDAASQTVLTTLTQVGTEPYGLAVAPNGEWFAVSGFRSGTIKFFDTQTLAEVAEHQYLRSLNFIPGTLTIADVDENRDGIPDTGDPRGFVIRADSSRLYVTHFRSSHVSVLDLTLDAGGLPTSVTQVAKIDTNEYPFDPFFNPVPVQTLESQGLPRFLEDIALSPDGSRALVPHVLHNVNHDVNHDFGPGFAGDFANRVYPALTTLDAVANTYGQTGDNSSRLHHELADDDSPAQFVPYENSGETSAGTPLILGGEGSPTLGGSADFVVSGLGPADTAILFYGTKLAEIPFGAAGTFYLRPRVQRSMPMGRRSVRIPNSAGLAGTTAYAQALVTVGGGPEQVLTNPVKFHIEAAGFVTNEMGQRAGQPSRVVYSPSGDHALMLNRGSEDLFLYAVSGSDLTLRTVYPERLDFEERGPLDKDTPMGDLPLGMAVVPDASTAADDALVYVINEGTRTLSILRVDWTAGTILPIGGQIDTLTGPDTFNGSERLGQELFEDASRAQTTDNFNNSCASCHFEGGEDGNVWQRPAGPRSTMPVYGGTLGTGLILWKGVRLNMGETGPMFGGENGGHGLMTDREQQGLTDYHERIAFPLNPNLDPVTGAYSALAAMGKDLYFGTNDTGMNMDGREAGCAECHPDFESDGANQGPRFYTADFLLPILTSGDNMQSVDPNCFSLRDNIVSLNIRDVNTGANTDEDGDGMPDMDRNQDGFIDLETYAIMNVDDDDDFQRDDPNGYLCPCPGGQDCEPNGFRIFRRDSGVFSIPTKLGVFSTGPYFHDHAPFSLRALLNPEGQATDPKYGSPAYPGMTPLPGLAKFFNEEHDILGHPDFGGTSDVQLDLQSTNAIADMEAILAYIESL